jgi:hypothetical protein
VLREPRATREAIADNGGLGQDAGWMGENCLHSGWIVLSHKGSRICL